MSYQRTPAAAPAGGSTPADGSVTDAKVANGAAINLDKTADGTTNKAYTATEKTKLAGVATAATANDTDANLKARANHTGTQLASTISDFSTAADARIAAAVGASVEAHDSDLTDIAALSPSNDDVIQRKSGAWTNRTVAQVKTDLALANVDNTSDASKPVSTATQTALDAKQALDSDLTTIAGLTATTDNFLQAKASAWASRTIAQVKTDLSISNVDNTSDANKPVSTATQTALDAKQALDSDLTTIAGLTATTDNILMSVSSAWASRTPVQVRTALGVGIGFNAPTGAYLQPSHMQTSAAGTPTTGRALFMPLDVGPSSLTLQSLSVNVTTALVVGSGNGVFTLGVYSDDGTGGAPLLTAPGLLFSGAVDPTSTGARHVSTSTVLSAGKRYWTAFLLYQTVAPTTAAAFSCLLSTTSLWSTSGSVPGAAARALLATAQTALPTSAVTWAVTASTEAPVVCARVA